ncbi:DUF2306 domain-containing protein [Paenibacillus septentrionalis]|uniref:DUF2306 domain-containing protein n=1 Tax=Paenibacillus septentrionalis TaxID=429342 RepID=A0ABW1V3T5_9BACL
MAKLLSKKTLIPVSSLLAIGVSAYLSIVYFGYGLSASGLIQNKLNQHMQLTNIYYFFLYLHIATGIISLVIGWLQFIKPLRERNIRLHRFIGKIYSGSVLFSACSGIFISFKATGGWISTVAFLALSLLWLYTLMKGYRAIVTERNPQHHHRWMFRNYALTFAAVTLRIYLPIFMLIFGFEHFDAYYRIVAWLSWVPNLLLAEWIIRRSRLFKT